MLSEMQSKFQIYFKTPGYLGNSAHLTFELWLIACSTEWTLDDRFTPENNSLWK